MQTKAQKMVNLCDQVLKKNRGLDDEVNLADISQLDDPFAYEGLEEVASKLDFKYDRKDH